MCYFWGMNEKQPPQSLVLEGQQNHDRQLVNDFVEESKDTSPWYALRLFGCRQPAVQDYFKDNGMECFIPLRKVDFEDRSGRLRHEVRPVVTNLLFVKKSVTTAQMTELVQNAPFQLLVIRKERGSKDYSEIPAKQMLEFRMMCDPEKAEGIFLSAEEAQLKPGDPVEVHFGPLKGLTGQLVRQNKKYYLLKEVTGLGVMVRVTRWCCKPASPK